MGVESERLIDIFVHIDSGIVELVHIVEIELPEGRAGKCSLYYNMTVTTSATVASVRQ